MGPRCSFCGASTGPFQAVEGLFTVPLEFLADHDPGQPWLHWGCVLCEHRVVIPQELEVHTAVEHPGWVARYEVVRPYPNQHLRVVYRQVDDQAG